MFIIDNAHKCRLLAASHSFVCVPGSKLVPQFSGHPGCTRLNGQREQLLRQPRRDCLSCRWISFPLLSQVFFARRKVFQRNTCECLKGGEMTAEAERQGYLLSSENRRSMSRWEGEVRRKVALYLDDVQFHGRPTTQAS